MQPHNYQNKHQQKPLQKPLVAHQNFGATFYPFAAKFLSVRFCGEVEWSDPNSEIRQNFKRVCEWFAALPERIYIARAIECDHTSMIKLFEMIINDGFSYGHIEAADAWLFAGDWKYKQKVLIRNDFFPSEADLATCVDREFISVHTHKAMLRSACKSAFDHGFSEGIAHERQAVTAAEEKMSSEDAQQWMQTRKEEFSGIRNALATKRSDLQRLENLERQNAELTKKLDREKQRTEQLIEEHRLDKLRIAKLEAQLEAQSLALRTAAPAAVTT